LDIKGLSSTTSTDTAPVQRITIGLFGKDAPDATHKLKQLVTKEGLPALCKPKDTTRLLQKEQLEASKVYNGCKESEDRGVNYDLSTIWRVVKDERIDVGAVSGKFISRENINWTGTNDLKHNMFGIVSVRRGTDSGFGFTIYPGSSSSTSSSSLDETNLVVGIVLDGLDTIQRINQVGVVRSAKLGGGVDQKAAPSRSCRYGSNELYCSENKPLQKLTIYSTGVL
jgi:cyclophilin family peptidyl-prolyl cis-trans isomerase